MSPTTGFIFIFIFAIFGVPLKADTPKGAYTQELKPLNPYDIKGDDIDKGGEVSKGIKPFQIWQFFLRRIIQRLECCIFFQDCFSTIFQKVFQLLSFIKVHIF